MILTGPAVAKSIASGDIVIAPFAAERLNPNSYNFRLGRRLLRLPRSGRSRSVRIKIPLTGYVLRPGQVYLGATEEKIGSDHFVTTLLGRSSLGRLGLFLNVTADLGHVGTRGRWTLELKVVQPLRVYPGMVIGQVAFWATHGQMQPWYRGRYHGDVQPTPNRDRSLRK